jgi:hypothetical protein
MGEIITRNWDVVERCVQVNGTSPIGQVQVPILRVIAPIRGLLNPITQVVLLISHSFSYRPYRFHLHPPSLSCPQLYHHCNNTKLGHPSLSLYAIIMS